MLVIILSLLFAPLLSAQSLGFVSLMPKKDVTEHWIIEGTPAEAWPVRDGVIACAGKPNGFLRSKKAYRDFVFRATWRFEKEGWQGAPERWPNAGFFINAGAIERTWPMSLEIQGHYGEAGSLFGVRGGKVSGAKRGPIVKNRVPFGDWDRIEITSQGGRIRVVLDGELVNGGHDIHPKEGNICLQSEGWPVFYRDLEIKELE